MADQIVSHALTKLGDLAIKEYFFLRGVSGEVKSVKLHLGQMKGLLKDAEDRMMKGDNGTEEWLRQVREMAFEIENAIDVYAVKTHIVKQKLVPLWKRYAVKIRALHKLGKEISGIKENIRTINESKTNLGIKSIGENVADARTCLQKPVLSSIDTDEIIGFEVDKAKIIDALIDGANTQKRRVVSIVGPGGLGKTTLAKKLFNNTEVRNYFNPRIWLTISSDFKPIDALKKLCEEATDYKRNEVEEPMVYLSKLDNHLREKRYLIVLDDVWSGEVMDWLKDGLPDVMKESRVMITTRSRDVANLADSSSVFELPLLTEEQSLILLLKNALQIPNVVENCPKELKSVATTLANRCKGLPLAIVVLGRLLSIKPHAVWYQMERNLDWYRDGKKCIDILASSYHDLPCYLKSCFRYLACFPEDFEISACSITKMWIAEGFIECHGEGAFEDEAERCLEELAQRSLVQVVKRSTNGSIDYFRVHDLLHDLAIHESRQNDFLLLCNNETKQTDLNKARRVVIQNNHDTKFENKNLEEKYIPNARSFLNFIREIPIGIRYPLLRVLELTNSNNLRRLPEELKNMIHLRYLGLENTKLEQLPETIGCLQNLQTINIRHTEVKKIPSSLWAIQALRHVTLNSTWFPGLPPLAKLVNLQTLQYFRFPKSWRDRLPYLPSLRTLSLGSTVMQDWNIILTLLGTLINLMSLSIEGDNIPVEIVDVGTSSSYQYLQTLHIFGTIGESSISTRFSLDTVEMPPNLIELILWNIWLDKDPMPKLGKLPCLKLLYLCNIENIEEMVCSAGGFPQLQDLTLEVVHDLKHWEVEKEAMSQLKTLNMSDCEKLSALPELNHVKTLQELWLDGISDVLHIKLRDRTGEEWQKIQHVPIIRMADY